MAVKKESIEDIKAELEELKHQKRMLDSREKKKRLARSKKQGSGAKPASKKPKVPGSKPATKRPGAKPASKKPKVPGSKPATKRPAAAPAAKPAPKRPKIPGSAATKKPAPKKPAAAPKSPKDGAKKPITKKPTKAELAAAKKEAERTLEEQLEEELSDEEIENFQIERVDMDRLTNKVCDILALQESGGMLQGMLWKRLKLNNRDGSRLALKLERNGTIVREKLLEKNRWTYKLILKKTPISTQSIENSPCLVCPVEQKCSLDGEISPRTCQYIEEWVLTGTKRKR